MGNPPPPGRHGQIIAYMHDDAHRRVEQRGGREGFLAWMGHRENACWSGVVCETRVKAQAAFAMNIVS